MRIVVTKSRPLLVRPSTEQSTPADHIKVSSFDKPLAFSSFSSFHVFDRAVHEPAKTIKRALSRALDHFCLIAGRVVVGLGDDDGDLCIACTGEGVQFVAATANCALVDVKLFDPPFAGLLRDLAVEYPEASCRVADPLLLLQVTEFSCGAFVVGVTWNHVVADGTGIALLLRAVGELARGLHQPSIPPVTCADQLLPDLPPLAAVVERTMVGGQLKPKGYAYLDITVPTSTIGRIKAEVGDELGAPCTVFEAVTAVLWQCRSRVIMPDGDQDAPAPLVFAADARRAVGAAEGYYSNCVTTQVVAPPPTMREVAEGDIKDVVRLIRSAKERISATFAGEEEGAPLPPCVGDTLFGHSALFVTSWRNLGFEATDHAWELHCLVLVVLY